MEMFTFLSRICNAIAVSLFRVFVVMVVFVQLLEPHVVFFVFLSVEMVVMLSARLHIVTSALPSGRDCKYTGQAVRALPIRIISVGKKRSQGVQLVVDEYIEKLKLYCSVDDVHIRNNPKNAHDSKAQVDHEDSAVMDLIRSDDWVVLLDEHGKDIGSEQMAELVGDAGNTGASRLSFCVGGPYGHGKRLRERADVSIKLSSMVLNHQIALVVLVEQLYRSWTILKGQNYHR
ncbi:putative RNA methyltransferase At5g10620 isoform X1 [Malus sylvestris]|uniref:putative RNA methyltransferase At5g10620 isoform X1 n=3 Tax=Malus sylvestris TaxID=3752 RepID=UPI0021AD221B|nr:putative RNA methyltransferase At5g10620 isoform X1 [Malus sylvestris]